MSSEVEAAGAAFTAGLAAAAIDKHSEGHAAAHGPCPNCGAEIEGNFCANCGQPAHVHRSLGHMAEEFLHGILHFDSRAWRTLPLLVFRPGTLTHTYIHGQRARYISPLAIFLLVVFTMFFVFSLSGGSHVGVSDPAKREAASQEVNDALTKRLANAEASLAERRAVPGSDNAATNPEAFAAVKTAEAQVASLRSQIKGIEAVLDPSHDATPDAPAVTVETNGDTTTRNVNIDAGLGAYEQIAEAAKSGAINIQTGWPDLDKKIMHKLENPELAVYKLQNGAYKLAFLLAPISLPFVWLLFFWKRGMTLFDHTVFILYSLSFVSLLFIVISLGGMLPGNPGGWFALLLFGIPVHFYFHMKGTYALGWFSALWRLPLLLTFACISLALFLFAIVAVGFVG